MGIQQLDSLTLVWPPITELKNSKLKPVKLRLKIDLVSHPVCKKGLGNYIFKKKEEKKKKDSTIQFTT